MQYFVLPIFLIIFFELLGQVIVQKFNIRKFKFNAIVGFSLFAGIYYVVCFPLVMINAEFKLVFIVTLAYFIIFIIWIFKNRKLLNFHYKRCDLIILVLLMVIQFYFVFRNTIGSVSLYDTINYANLTTSNIYLDGLNTFEFTNGFDGRQVGYAFQSYYILASFMYYILNGICNIFKIDFFYFTQHTWMYSVILYYLFGEMIINFIDYFRIKNKFSYLFIFLFIVTFMGNFYWNSEQAYLGNSFRMLLVSYSLIYLKDYINKNDINCLMFFGLIHLANCSCANSNSTLTLIIVFGVWLFIPSDKYNFRIILSILIPPVFNILYQLSGHYVMCIISSVALFIIFIFADQLIKFINNFKIKKMLIFVVAFFLTASSLAVTKNIFNFDAFLNNLSGWSDMTWDYTDVSNLWRLSANLIYLFITLIVYCKNKNETLFKILFLIMLVFFNPFAAPIQNKYMVVFYRNYDICMNYFILFAGISTIENIGLNKKMNNTIICIIMLLSLVSAIGQYNYHPNNSFDLYEGYNPLLRMSDDEAETIRFVKDYVLKNGMTDDVLTISSILQIHTELPWLKTLYGRNKKINGISDYELYKIFYPADYYGDPWAPKNPKYENMCELVKKERYELIIQDKRVDYYDKNNDSYYSIRYLIDKCGSYPIYENETFVVYRYIYE